MSFTTGSAMFWSARNSALHLQDPFAQLSCDLLDRRYILSQDLGGLRTFSPGIRFLEVQMPAMRDERDLSQRLGVVKRLQVIRHFSDLFQADALLP